MRYFHLVKVFVQQVKILSGFIPPEMLTYCYENQRFTYGLFNNTINY